MRKVNIYALIHPITGHPFYVGATVLKLEVRLYGHLTLHSCCGKGWVLKRDQIIQPLLKKGIRPKIILLQETELDYVDFYEEYFYKKFTLDGISLIQAPFQFRYSKSKSKMIKKEKKNALKKAA